MRSLRRVTVAACLIFVGAAALLVRLHGQSLADVAKKEEERRKTVAQPAKTYTNKDLSPAPSPAPAPPAKDAKDGKSDKDAADKGKDAKDAADKDAKAGDGRDASAKDQKYWSDKLKALREQLDRDSSFADALQTKINALTTDFVNRDDPVQKRQIDADRTKALADLTKLKKSVADDQKALADFAEEARRAGVPAGWLR